MGHTLSTCARVDGCDGRETVVDRVDYKRDRALPDSPRSSQDSSDEASQGVQEEPWIPSDVLQSLGQMQAGLGQMDPRLMPAHLQPQMHPMYGGQEGMHMQQQMQGSWVPPPAQMQHGQPMQRVMRNSVAQVVPGPGWQAMRPAPQQAVRQTSRSMPQQGVHNMPPQVMCQYPESQAESNMEYPSPVPTEVLPQSQGGAPQPVPTQTHRLQSVPSLKGIEQPPASSFWRSPVASLVGQPIQKPASFQVIATVADFEKGFELFGAKIRDAALQAGHTSETMDNKYVSITDSYGRVFNWHRPLDFEPSVDMFPLMYRYTPPDGEQDIVNVHTPMGNSRKQNMINALMEPEAKSRQASCSGAETQRIQYAQTARQGSGGENYPSTTLPMVMLDY